MSLVINTNTTAASAANQLSKSNSMLQKSLDRLSSGSKIINPSDDAGGLAVSVKMSASINRTAVVKSNVENAISFLQTQDGALKTVGGILDRISELRTLYDDVTKSASDKSNYSTEFTQLQAQLVNLQGESFNGVSLFGDTSPGTVKINQDGTQSFELTASDLQDKISSITADSVTKLSDISVEQAVNAISGVASLRATNGAQSSRLQFAGEMLSINKVNLEAANSRIIDTDIAEESTKFAKYQILSQAGASMLAQANSISQTALQLLR